MKARQQLLTRAANSVQHEPFERHQRKLRHANDVAQRDRVARHDLHLTERRTTQRRSQPKESSARQGKQKSYVSCKFAALFLVLGLSEHAGKLHTQRHANQKDQLRECTRKLKAMRRTAASCFCSASVGSVLRSGCDRRMRENQKLRHSKHRSKEQQSINKGEHKHLPEAGRFPAGPHRPISSKTRTAAWSLRESARDHDT
jgi:hypothetical protein